MKTLMTAAVAAMVLAAPAFAGGHAAWKSIGDESLIAFGSVKKDVVGEVHTFGDVSGTVSEGGDVAIAIQLASVETNIDIRNERMIEHVFKGMDAVANLTGSVDMDDVNDLAVGATTVTDFEGTLSLAGVASDIETELFVARLSEDRVLVTTSDILMLSTADIGVNAGVDKLMELASLPGITRVSPATVRMVFEK
ncbi:YceI family protein [Cognatishimia sp.]|uniref:YceI family protein n=1 Tax=Cognatishimia sp. TaxID=2211648 RepID=UPI003512E2B6|nr:YceI family protein [Cognatishimia sp.]